MPTAKGGGRRDTMNGLVGNIPNYSMTNQTVIPYAANQPQTVRLPVSGNVRSLTLELTGTLNVTVGGTAMNGIPGNLIPYLKVSLNGPNILHDGRWNDWTFARGYAFTKLPAETAPTGGVASTAIYSMIRIPFITPWAVRPEDTILPVSNTDRLEVQVQWGDENSLVSGGTKAWTTNPQITVIPEVTVKDGVPIGYYREFAIDSQTLGAVANTNTTFQLNIGAGQMYHHCILIAEDIVAVTGRNRVATALNNVQLNLVKGGQTSQPIGPLTGTQIRFEYDQYFNRGGVQTGVYPIVFGPRFGGTYFNDLDVSDVAYLQVQVNNAAFATNGILRAVVGQFNPF
jgi:hypothetical protein